MNTMQKITGMAGALALTAGMVAGFAMPADAAPPAWAPETRSVTVAYGDIDLATDAGVRALYARLRDAAGEACGSYAARDLAARADWKRCRATALADAVERLGNGRLDGLHRGDAPAVTTRIAGRQR